MLHGCGAGVSDEFKKLPNGYVYIEESSKHKWIMKNPLPANSDLYVPCQVVNYHIYKKQYIIAKIKFLHDDICAVGFVESQYLKYDKLYFYIIDTKKEVRYGPFKTFANFKEQLNALNIAFDFSSRV